MPNNTSLSRLADISQRIRSLQESLTWDVQEMHALLSELSELRSAFPEQATTALKAAAIGWGRAYEQYKQLAEQLEADYGEQPD